jgi:hypothetical protein
LDPQGVPTKYPISFWSNYHCALEQANKDSPQSNSTGPRAGRVKSSALARQQPLVPDAAQTIVGGLNALLLCASLDLITGTSEHAQKLGSWGTRILIVSYKAALRPGTALEKTVTEPAQIARVQRQTGQPHETDHGGHQALQAR